MIKFIVFIANTVVLTQVKLPGPFTTIVFFISLYLRLFSFKKSSKKGINLLDSFHFISIFFSFIISLLSSNNIIIAFVDIVFINIFIFLL
ncbi:MAG: hypothetical protein P1U46_02515 [Patescibacteria group bacterium]|nr:hypothetical protein [Patescibacteria group bacterium]